MSRPGQSSDKIIQPQQISFLRDCDGEFTGLKVTPDLRGCPSMSSGKRIHMVATLKENKANYISLESLINVDFGKNMNCQFF